MHVRSTIFQRSTESKHHERTCLFGPSAIWISFLEETLVTEGDEVGATEASGRFFGKGLDRGLVFKGRIGETPLPLASVAGREILAPLSVVLKIAGVLTYEDTEFFRPRGFGFVALPFKAMEALAAATGGAEVFNEFPSSFSGEIFDTFEWTLDV